MSITFTRGTVEYAYKWLIGDISRGGPASKMQFMMKQKNIITLGSFTTRQAKKSKASMEI